MVFHSIKSKYPSLRKNQECKEGENRMVQVQQEGEQCHLIRTISTFQNWTHGKRQGFEPRYKMKFGINWSISPRVCDCSYLSGSPGTNIETANMIINGGWKGRDYRRHPHAIVTASTHVEKIVRRFGTIILHHQKTKAQPCTKMSCTLNIRSKINYFCFRTLNTVSNSFQNSIGTSQAMCDYIRHSKQETSKNSFANMDLFHMARTEIDDRPYAIGLAAKCVKQQTHKEPMYTYCDHLHHYTV